MPDLHHLALDLGYWTFHTGPHYWRWFISYVLTSGHLPGDDLILGC